MVAYGYMTMTTQNFGENTFFVKYCCFDNFLPKANTERLKTVILFLKFVLREANRSNSKVFSIII